MNKPYRISEAGSKIDRSAKVRFSFDGVQYTGFKGDTLASALLANGVRLMGRSFKYHRPRSVMALGAEEANALVTIGTEEFAEPNLRASQIEIYTGLVATSQNRWPSLKFDVGAINQLGARFMPGGFYYKTFMGPTQSAWMWFEPMIRRAAGLGPAPTGSDPSHYEQLHYHTDVMIVGGGVTGLSAALAAIETGARVLLADETDHFGGTSDLFEDTINGEAAHIWVANAVATLKSSGRAVLLNRTTAAGLFHQNYSLLHERVSDHDPDAFGKMAVRHRLWKVRPKKIILATGALERPLTFTSNDRPGVMLSSAARGYAQRFGTAIGVNTAIFTNNDDGYATALSLHKHGVNIPAIIDIRPENDGPNAQAARAAGIQILNGHGIIGVKTASGGAQIKGLRTGVVRESGRIGATSSIECDAIASAGGWNPVVHLHCHNGGKLNFDETRQMFVPNGQHPDGVMTVGAAAGIFDLSSCLQSGFDAGEGAARQLGFHKARTSTPPQASKPLPETPMTSQWFIPALGSKSEGNKHFLDYQNDVTVADIELANREGYQSVEHVKRYTTLGMATDQGKTSNINALGILADVQNKPIPAIGTTTFRPPYTPISFGSMVGQQAGDLFAPIRPTAVQTWHQDQGAVFEPVGLWRRPFCYPKGEETHLDAINREVLAVRNQAGILDASTLGKIEISGPDAAQFLDRLYTNLMSSLKPGRCRYGLMLNENGFLMDDGVVVRLSENRFLCHTTSGGAENVASWCELWHQTEWPELKVFITPVTEQWAQFAVAGPKARDILQSLESDIDFSNDAFPFMTFKTGTIQGTRVRVFRISFSGEVSYEVACPASEGLDMWTSLLDAGQSFGLQAYGTEAMHVLRAEKGYIIVGDETDGVTTPADLGLSWALSKKKTDYIGRFSLSRSHMQDPNRVQLVGLKPDNPNDVIPVGAYAVKEVKDNETMQSDGYVTSSYHSPTLGHSIALAMIPNGPARMGETLSFPLENKTVSAQIVSPVFYDPEGKRLTA